MVNRMRKTSDYKLMARQRMFYKYGTLAGGTAIYGAIYVGIFILVLIAYSSNLLSQGVFQSVESMQAYIDEMAVSVEYTFIMEGIIILISALMSTVSVALQYMCLKVARGQETKISDLLYVVKNNPDKVIIIFLVQHILTFVCNLPANMLALYINRLGSNASLEIVYYVFMIIGYIADIIFIVLFSQAMFIYIDDPQLNSMTCIRTSTIIMTKHFKKFISLYVSFIPMYIMAMFTLGVGYIWVIPYQYTTFALFYMQLKGELGSTVDVTV